MPVTKQIQIELKDMKLYIDGQLVKFLYSCNKHGFPEIGTYTMLLLANGTRFLCKEPFTTNIGNYLTARVSCLFGKNTFKLNQIRNMTKTLSFQVFKEKTMNNDKLCNNCKWQSDCHCVTLNSGNATWGMAYRMGGAIPEEWVKECSFSEGFRIPKHKGECNDYQKA